MASAKGEPGLLEFSYFGKIVRAWVYQCEKKHETVDEEIERLGLSYAQPIAVIPLGLVTGAGQIVQGIFHYYMNGHLLERFRNKGLLLAMLILGCKQLSEALDKIRGSFGGSGHYLLISLDGPIAREGCHPCTIGETVTDRDLPTLLKNLANLLELL